MTVCSNKTLSFYVNDYFILDLQIIDYSSFLTLFSTKNNKKQK